MAINYRRGSASIEAAATKKGGAGFRRFIPEVQWADDETKYILVLTDLPEVAELLLHSFIPVGKGVKNNGEEYIRYEDFLSRKMEGIGEDYDDLEDRLEREPKLRHMGVMAELEPIMEPGTKKITGFVVKTETFTRQSDDGEIDVTAPVIGLCTQSAQLMWGPLNSLCHQLGDLISVPLAITRHGVKTNTRYDIIPFMEKPVDLSPAIQYLDGINYIGDDLDDLVQAISAEETDQAGVQAIADFLLRKRVDELGDPVRYEELVGSLNVEDMPKNNWGRKEKKAASNSRPSRPARRSPREATEAPAEVTAEAPAELSRAERFEALRKRVEAA